MIGVVLAYSLPHELKLDPDVGDAKDHKTKHGPSHLPAHQSRQESKPRGGVKLRILI